MKCKNCGKELQGNEHPKDFCCYACYENWTKWNKKPNCKCPVCGKEFYTKPSRIANTQNPITCSRDCGAKFKSIWFSGVGNHQFGLKGDLNSSFKGDEISRKNNNIVEICVYYPDHPNADRNGRVTKHRLVVEQNHSLFDDSNFDIVDGMYILKTGLEVHHKDGNHNNNNVDNLQIITRSEHRRIHNMEKRIIRDPKTGRILGITKISSGR